MDSDGPSTELFNKSGNKVDGTYKKINDESSEPIYDKNGNKLEGTFRKVEEGAPKIEAYNKNGKKLPYIIL